MPPLPPFDPAAHLGEQTRRHFFRRCAMGLGGIALASMLGERRLYGAAAPAALPDPLAPKPGHHPARARNIIYLFMAGAPSQLELFDYKPRLIDLNGKPVPPSRWRIATVDTAPA